jgi:N4-gp56 family major capsid protein
MQTDFGAQKPSQILNWRHKAYRAYRDNLFWRNYQGKAGSGIVERVTEITKNDRGTTGAMLRLIADPPTGGIIGDNEVQGRQAKLQTYWQQINIDQISNAVENKGRLDDQGSVDDFRTEGRERLARVDAQTWDELHFLTASGIAYSLNCDGSTRVPLPGQDDLNDLVFAADVSAPTTNRHFNWTGTALDAGDTSSITSAFKPAYGMIIDAMTEARTRKVKPLKISGQDFYLFLIHPRTYGTLKKDSDFRTAVVQGMPRGANNPVFTGATITLDGAIIATHNSVYNTKGAASGSKWGSGGAVDGTRSLLLGAQALGLADLEVPQMEEEAFDHNRRQSICIEHMGGLLKPQFYSVVDKSVEDFGVIAIDHAI